jgi:hypothetical protein
VDQIKTEGEKVYQSILHRPEAGYWDKVWAGKIDVRLADFYRHHRLSSDYEGKEEQINEMAMAYIRQAIEFQKRGFEKQLEGKHLELRTEMKAIDRKTMVKFYDKLAARRIALALFKHDWDINDIAGLLTYGNLKGLPSPPAIRQLFNAHLSLSTDLSRDIPARILVEERLFLEAQGFAVRHRDIFSD